MAEILHCPIFRAGHISAGPSTVHCKGAQDINSWPHVRVLFADVCAQCSLNARLSWSPGSYLHGCMCSPRPPNVHSALCKVQMCSIVGRILFALDLALALDRPSGADVVLCESCVISLVVSLFLLFVLLLIVFFLMLLTVLFILLLVLLNAVTVMLVGMLPGAVFFY